MTQPQPSFKYHTVQYKTTNYFVQEGISFRTKEIDQFHKIYCTLFVSHQVLSKSASQMFCLCFRHDNALLNHANLSCQSETFLAQISKSTQIYEQGIWPGTLKPVGEQRVQSKLTGTIVVLLTLLVIRYLDDSLFVLYFFVFEI